MSKRSIKEWTLTKLKSQTIKLSFTFTFYFLLWQAKLPAHMSRKVAILLNFFANMWLLDCKTNIGFFRSTQITLNSNETWKQFVLEASSSCGCDLLSETLQHVFVSWILEFKLFRKTSLRTWPASGASLITTSHSNVLRVPEDIKAPPTVISLFYRVPS